METQTGDVRLLEIETDLYEALLWDRPALKESTQALLVEQFLRAGHLVLHGGELPRRFAARVVDAARYFGHKVLAEVGEDHRQLLATIAKDSNSAVDHEYAMNCACSCVDTLMALWGSDMCLEAHINAASEDDDTEQLERARKDLHDIGENYRREMATPAGMKVLQLLKADCNYIQNRKAMLPAGSNVPWFLDV